MFSEWGKNRLEKGEIQNQIEDDIISLQDAKELLREKIENNSISQPECLGEASSSEMCELSDAFMEKFPQERNDAVKMAFENSPKEYMEMLEKNKDNLKICESRGKEGCYYLENGVYMRRDLDDEEYADILRHEVSHYLDDQKGWFSENIEYINAVYDDTMALNFSEASTRERRQEMLDELFSSDVCYNRHVSDILSAVSRNNPKLILRYTIEGVPYYRHKNEYFDRGHNRENEIYADVMACISENDAETIAFVKKYFPNIYEATRQSMQEEEHE